MKDILMTETTDTTDTTDTTESRVSFLITNAGETLDQLMAVVTAVIELEGKVEYQETILGDHSRAIEQNCKYLLQEQQVGDSNLDDQLRSLYHIVVSQGERIRQLDDKLDATLERNKATHNAVGYCLRKVESAIVNDPANAYLKQVMEAIDDLKRKLD